MRNYIVLLILVLIIPLIGCEKEQKPHRAENGDYYNKDNDGDGRKEPIFVKGYKKQDGTVVRS